MSGKLFLRCCGASGAIITGTVALKVARDTWNENKNKVFASDSSSSRENVNGYQDELKLIQAQVFFRHGARTPLKTIPNIKEAEWDPQLFLSVVPHTSYSYTVYDTDGGLAEDSPLEKHYRRLVLKGGCYSGQLTTLGQDQTYLLGRRLRKLYVNQHGLISPEYHPDIVYSRTTNTQRTIDSLRCVVAGIYGAEHLRDAGEVQFFTSKVEDEFLFPNSHHCLFMKQLNHKTLTNFGNIQGVREDRLNLEQVLGIDSSNDVKKRISMVDVRDDIVCRASHGFAVPDKVKSFREVIERYALSMMVYANSGPEGSLRDKVLRLAVGRSLKNLFEKIESLMKTKSDQKLLLYSCHDTSLTALLVAFGIYDGKWPPFAADIAIELYKDNKGEHFVKLNYLGENVTKKRFGTPLVSVKTFRDSVSKYMLGDREYENTCVTKLPQKLDAPSDLGLPNGYYLPDHEETPAESQEAEEKADLPAGM